MAVGWRAGAMMFVLSEGRDLPMSALSRKVVIAVASVGQLAVVAGAAEKPEGSQKRARASGPLAWVYRDKIRMGWSPSSPADYETMARAGMNAVMPRLELDAVVDYDPIRAEVPCSDRDAQVLTSLRETSRKARQTGLHYFHCLDIAASSQTWRVGFKDNPARFNDGDLPSPVDPVYWRRAIVQRVQRALDLLDGDAYALDAVIIDPEMYAIHAGVPGGPDYGRYAFETFLAETSKPTPADVTTPDQRRQWLKTQELDKDYVRWQHRRVASLAAALRKTVHARHPNAILGFIVYKNRMWFNAMAVGLYAPGRPVFVGPETTYSGVMDDSFVAYARSLRRTVKVPCLFVPGLRMGLEGGRVPEAFLKVVPGNLYQRCQHSEGYWIWSIYRFGKGAQPERFFSVLRRVNEALDRQAKTGVVDQTLKAAPLPVELPPDLQQRLATAARLRPVKSPTSRTTASASSRAGLAFVAPKLRGTHTLILWPQQGQRQDTTLTIRAIKLGNLLAATSVRVFGPQGRALWAETVPPGSTRVIRVPATETGPRAAVISAGMNAYQIVDVSCPAMLCQDKTGVSVNARGLAGRFYFHVPPSRSHFTIQVRGYHTEYADYVLSDPNGRGVKHWKMVRRAITEKIAPAAPGIWSLVVDRVIDDAGFSLVDLPNRFALRPEDVYDQPRP